MATRDRSFFFDVSTGTLRVADASVSTTTIGEENYGSVDDVVTTSFDYDLVTDTNATFLDYGAVEDSGLVQAVADTLVNSFRIDTSSITLYLKWELKTASFVAVNGGQYFVNTTSGAVTVTLPASPSIGDHVSIIDSHANAATNNITIDRNGNNIMGSASNDVLNTNDARRHLSYVDATRGWVRVDGNTG